MRWYIVDAVIPEKIKYCMYRMYVCVHEKFYVNIYTYIFQIYLGVYVDLFWLYKKTQVKFFRAVPL